MDRITFWTLINNTRRKSKDSREHVSNLVRTLTGLDISEITSFEKNLSELLQESYSADLWNVVYIIEGGCGNDGFDYFRGWLILQGEDFFYTILKIPSKLPDLRRPDDTMSCESLLGAAKEAYKAKTGDWKMPYDCPTGPGKLNGVLLREDDDLKGKYPEIWKKYVEKC